MKRGNYRLCILVLLAVFLLPEPAQAAGPIDLSRDVSLQVAFSWEKEPLTGAEFSLWQVCRVDDYGYLTPREEFAEFSQLLDIQGQNDQRWQEAARELERYLLNHPEIAPTDSAVTGEQGIAEFPSDSASLPQGLYLVRSVHHLQENHVYATAPFFVMLPNRDRNLWDYTVQARAKVEQREERISLRVIKEWEDKYWEHNRPDRIQVLLYRDEVLYDTVILPQNGKWTYQWAGLDAAHSWWVAEEAVEGYTTRIARKENTFYITNTYAASGPEDPTLPQTGQLWWPVPVLLAAGLLLIILGLMRWRKYSDEREA